MKKSGTSPGRPRDCGDVPGTAGTSPGTAGTSPGRPGDCGDVPGTSPIFSTEPLPTIECSKKIVEIKINLDQPNTALDIRIVAFIVGIWG